MLQSASHRLRTCADADACATHADDAPRPPCKQASAGIVRERRCRCPVGQTARLQAVWHAAHGLHVAWQATMPDL